MEKSFSSVIETFLSGNHSDRALEKGREYVGEFVNRLTSYNQIMGATKGRYGTYNTRLNIEGNTVCIDCDCPSSKLSCHHAIGLALTYLNFPDSFMEMNEVASHLEKLRKEDLLEMIFKIVPKKPQSFAIVEQAVSKSMVLSDE